MKLFFRLVNDYVNCFKFGDSLPKRSLQGDKNIAGILFGNIICMIFSHSSLTLGICICWQQGSVRQGLGLCPVTWITMNHMQYWTQWHFKSLSAIEWSSHSAWMNKRGRMEGGTEGRWNSQWEGKKKKQKALSSASVGQRHNCRPGSESLTPSNSSGSTTSVDRNHLNGWFRPCVLESTQGLGAWLAVNPHRTFLGSISSIEKCTPPCPTLKISVHRLSFDKVPQVFMITFLITYRPRLIRSLYIWENWSPEMLRNRLKTTQLLACSPAFMIFLGKKKKKTTVFLCVVGSLWAHSCLS